MRYLGSLLIILFYCNTLFSQAINQGKVVYSISYPESNYDKQAIDMMPTEAVMYFKDNNSRMEIQMGMGMSMVTISDSRAKTTTVLMDILGNKTAMKMTEDDIKKEARQNGEFEVLKTEETKTIAGYSCKKAIVTLGEKNSFNVWYTNDIKANNSNWNNQFKNIDGFLMEFRMDQSSGLSMLMTAKTISNDNVPVDLFDVPSDYKVMTKDEMIKMYEGKGSK